MRSRATLVVLIVVIALAGVGTVLWITGILRPAPPIAPGVVRAVSRPAGVLDLTVDVSGVVPIDRAGETVRQVARSIARGALSAPPLVLFDFRAAGAPLMRLAYDPGVLASGAVSGGTGDHMLGLAGLGSRLPVRNDARLVAYCGRMETMTGAFCKRTRGG